MVMVNRDALKDFQAYDSIVHFCRISLLHQIILKSYKYGGSIDRRADRRVQGSLLAV